jgi:hypothetical protein
VIKEVKQSSDYMYIRGNIGQLYCVTGLCPCVLSHKILAAMAGTANKISAMLSILGEVVGLGDMHCIPSHVS